MDHRRGRCTWRPPAWLAPAWLIVVLLVSSTAASARAETVDLEELRERADAVAAGEEDSLGDVDAVRLPNGDVVGWEGGVLSGDRRPEQAEQLLDTLAALAEQGGPAVDPEEARRLAREAVPEEDDKPPPRPPEMPDAGFGAGALANVIAFAVLGVVVAGVVYAIVRLVASRRPREDDKEDEPPEPGVVVGDRPPDRDRDAVDWERRAREAAEAGDYAEAVRCLHLAGIVRLDRDGHLHFEPSTTNGEYVLTLLERDPDAALALRHLSTIMEASTFGSVPTDAGTYTGAVHGWQELHTRLSGVRR